MLYVNNPPPPQTSAPLVENVRTDVRTRIYEILRRRLRSGASMDTKCLYDVTNIIEERLFQSAESFEDYSDFQSLQQRVLSLLDHFKRNLNRCRLQDATSTSLGGPQQTSTPSKPTILQALHLSMERRHQSTNHQVTNIYTPNMNQVTSGPQGISLPLANGPKTPPQELFTGTHLSQPNHLQASPQMHRYSIRNVDSRVSSIVATSSGSIAVSRDLVPFNLTQLSQQLSNHGVHKKSGDIERQGLPSQKLYPSQLQMGTGLAAPLKQGPSLTLYKEARERQATNGITPTKLQYQHTDVKDHYIGVQSAFVPSSTQPNSSPYFRPHPHQKQSTSIMVQGHSSQQKATEIPENNNVAPISVQTVERKRLPDGKDTSSKQVNEDCGQKDVKALRWLLFMHHVRGCTATEGNCDSKFCFKGKMLLKHIEGCMVPDCTYHLCLCTRKWMSHYNHCKDKSCPVCVYVKNFKQKEKSKRLLLLRGDKCSSASQPMRSSESSQGYNKRRADDDLLPSNKRMKIGRPSENAIPETRCGVVCKPHSPMDMQEKDGVQSDGCKSVEISIPEMKNISASGPMQSSESRERHNIRGVEAPSVDDDPEPSIKRQKIERPSENAIPETKSISVTGCGVCKPHLPMDMQEKDGVQSDGCKSVENAIPEMNISASGPMQSSKSRERDNIRGVDTPFVDDDPEPSIKRQKIERPSEITIPETNSISVTGCGVVCKPHSPMDMQEKDGLQSDGCKSVEVEVKYMDIDASKMEISSLVELFTPEQVKEHISSLHQWEGQSKTKADKNKAKGCSKSENACQLCDVEMLLFEQIPHYCSHCSVRIKKNVWHYSVAAGESRHYVCTPCYNKEREDSVSIDGDCIQKTKFEKNKNDEETEEKWVQCDKCKAWQHQICALFNCRRNRGEATKYTCPNCYIEEVEQGERKPLPPSAILGAKDLPVTALSNHIEERLFEKLKMEREERARLQQKTYDEVPGAESLTVRVVASVDKVSEVKERFFELFREENYPSNFPYKSKAILLFQKIENVEVCLFGMFVQEYGTESGSPNERRVYISYLDSVKYFRPEVRTVSGEALRTFVYHEILIGYLDYCKKRGFTSCYIWACPPRKGDDYILYCHPEIQKTPKTDKLREWYLAMLKKASKEDVVAEWTNLYDHLFVQSGECKANVTATRVPYYDGDYWPRAAEDIIREMSQEDNKTELNRKVLTKKLAPKRDLRSSDHLDLSVTASKDLLMMQKFGQIICPKKEDFIMVHLQHCCHHCSTLMISGNRWVCKQCKNFQICEKCNKVEQNLVAKERHPKNQRNKHKLFPVAVKDVPTKIEDKDDNLESVLFETRQAFLSLCQGNNYQYDTLRRAKYSSMMLLYHLHNPTSPKFVPICTICNEEVENSQGWHCEVCPAYDVCNTCYSEESFNHSHNLISRSSSTDNVVTDQNMQTTQNGQTKLEKFIASLVHVTECRSTQCQYLGCQQTKKLCRHCIACKIGPGDCVHCKKFWTLIKIHSRRCRDSECSVPKCREFKAIESSCSQIKKGIEVLCGGN